MLYRICIVRWLGKKGRYIETRSYHYSELLSCGYRKLMIKHYFTWAAKELTWHSMDVQPTLTPSPEFLIKKLSICFSIISTFFGLDKFFCPKFNTQILLFSICFSSLNSIIWQFSCLLRLKRACYVPLTQIWLIFSMKPYPLFLW